MARITGIVCGLLPEEQRTLHEIEARLHQLFQMADAIAECQREAGHHYMGETMRRMRHVGVPKSPHDQMQELSVTLEQVLYACMKSGLPFQKVLNIVFGRLMIRVEEEGMNRKLESELIDDALRNLAASRQEVGHGK